jgi:alpha-L-fucosidase
MNGNLLLNLSPEGQGAINTAQRTTLLAVGHWLSVNGEAIYGTHNWTTDGEGFPRLPPHGSPAASAAPRAAAPAAAAGGAPGPKPVVYRFTVKGDDLYAIAQSWPGETAVIASLGTGKAPQGKITSVTLLGSPGTLKFTQNEQGLKVELPKERPGNYAYALKITGLKMNQAGPPVPAVMADLR